MCDSSGFPSLRKSWGDVFPPASTFNADLIPDLSGRVAIVTGGNTGIGWESCRVLLEHGARVYLASRGREKAQRAIASLKDVTGKDAIFLEVDLSSLSSVKKAAMEFLSKERQLHILMNSAGVMNPPLHQVTVDGYDLQWGTNVLGHFFLTELLIPALVEGARTSPDRHARIVTTSSTSSYLARHGVMFDTLKDGPARRSKDIDDLYSQSKLGNVIIAHQVARRYADQGIISIAVHPGMIQTDLQRHMNPIGRSVAHALMYPPSKGALTQLFAATMPDALNHNGEVMIPWARPGKTRPEAYDDELGGRVWNWCEEQIRAF